MRWNSAANFIISTGKSFSWIPVLVCVLLSEQTSPPSGQPAPAPSAGPNSPPTQSVTPAQNPAPKLPLVLIDAAHGGSEPGAILASNVPEKDVTLAYSRRLRQELLARGFQAQVIRDGDFALSTDQRVSIANSVKPALYICVHAASTGVGIHVYSPVLPLAGENNGAFLNWATAQSSSLSRSRMLQQQITSAIQKMGFPVKALAAPLRPLNSIVVPAIALEIAPANGTAEQLASVDYQNMTAAAVANAISTVRQRLETAP